MIASGESENQEIRRHSAQSTGDDVDESARGNLGRRSVATNDAVERRPTESIEDEENSDSEKNSAESRVHERSPIPTSRSGTSIRAKRCIPNTPPTTDATTTNNTGQPSAEP